MKLDYKNNEELGASVRALIDSLGEKDAATITSLLALAISITKDQIAESEVPWANGMTYNLKNVHNAQLGENLGDWTITIKRD